MAYFYQGNISPIELTVNGTSKFKGVDTSTPGILQVYDNDSTHYAQIQAPAIISTNYSLILPTDDGDANQVLQTNGSGILSWANNSTLSGSGLIGLIENNSIWLGTDPSSTTNTAENNVAVGIGSLDAITTGDHNVAIGYNSATTLDTGYKNVLLGSLAGQAITSGYQNLAIGYGSGYTITEGYQNIYIGDKSGYWSTTPTENTCLGTYTGQKITTGSKNTFIGQESGNSDSSIAALTGHENTCLGYKSGVIIQGASQYNTLIGSSSGDAITTGTDNVIVGYNSDPSSATGTNQIVIGSGTTGQGDNKVVIGNASITDIYMASDASATVRCGRILAQTSNDSADVIKLHADAGALQTINIVNDEGTSNSAIALTSNAGGITLSSKNLFYNTDTINVGIGGDITSLTANGTVHNPTASTVLLKSVNGVFVETNILNSSDGVEDDEFGNSVSISGTGNDAVAIIGSYRDDDSGSSSGSAYIFDKSSGSWAQIAKLVANDAASSDFFGYSVFISGTGNDAVAIIGAYRDETSKGAAYIFDKSSGSWAQIAKLVASDGAAYDNFIKYICRTNLDV